MSRNFLSKFFALVCVMLFGISTSWADDTTIYSWVSTGSDASGVTQSGGTASGKIGQNKPNENVGQLYALQIAADKASALKTLNDHVTITLADGATFKAGDKVTVKGYYTKNENKSVSLAILPGENDGTSAGTDMSKATGCLLFTDTDWPNLYTAEALSTQEHTYELTAAYEGKTQITLTRNSSSTTLFVLDLKITREESGETPSVDPTPDPGDDPSVDPADAHLLWDYTEAAPAANPDNGLTYASVVNDPAGTKNGLKGIKMNSSGYAYFTKAAVKGTLKLTFGPRDGNSEIKLGVYSYASEPKAETLIETTAGVTELQTLSIDLTAAQNNIYINRASGAEGVLTKVEFVPFVPRTFQDFELNFVNVTALPETPAGVTSMEGKPRNDAHGLDKFKMVVPVDGAVKITIGGCEYSNTEAKINNASGATLASIDVKTPKCYHNGGVATYIYSGGADVLTIIGAEYTPYIKIEAIEVSPCTVTFKDQDGNVIGTVDTFEGEALGTIPYGESDITVPEGSKFRGWVYASGVKAKATDLLSGNTTITAKVTPIESVTVGSVQNYNLASNIFYPEDHETISIEGGYYHDSTHGWAIATDGKVSVDVAGNAQVVLSLCKYSKDAPITVTDAEGNEVATIASAKVENDGALATVQYAGPATALTFTFAQGESYLHKVTVYNVQDFLEKDEKTGWYIVPAGDAAALMLALNSANAETGATIFLPNGTYDLGNTVLTTISGNNMSIIGESMEGTIIKTKALEEKLGVADLFYNTSTGLYMQDLTLQNDFDYYNSGAAGRAAVLQDNGNQTILRNVAMRSYQDTYYSKSGNYYFEGGLIQGTVDYICGGGNAWFENITLLNKSRSKSGNTGDDTMTAYQGTGKYIFNNSSVESECETFNFGRSWADAYVVYLNTTIKSGKLIDTRFSTADMNSAPRFFGEYNTTDLSGNGKNTPASNVLTTSKGANFESVLTAEQAEAYTLESLFGSWTPKTIAAQEVADPDHIDVDALYLVEDEGEFVAIIKGSEIAEGVFPGMTIRKANARGGFGEAVDFGADEEVSITIDEHLYVTYYNGTKTTELPEGVTAYCVSFDEEEGNISLYSLASAGEKVNRGVPVVLKAETEGDYVLKVNAYKDGWSSPANILFGSDEDTETSTLVSGNADDYYYYALSLNQDNEIGFYWMNSEGAAFTNQGGKAFLAIEKSKLANDSKITGFSLNGDVTAIQTVTSSATSGKVYDVAGREVKAPAKGLYIVNGKKIIK